MGEGGEVWGEGGGDGFGGGEGDECGFWGGGWGGVGLLLKMGGWKFWSFFLCGMCEGMRRRWWRGFW